MLAARPDNLSSNLFKNWDPHDGRREQTHTYESSDLHKGDEIYTIFLLSTKQTNKQMKKERKEDPRYSPISIFTSCLGLSDNCGSFSCPQFCGVASSHTSLSPETPGVVAVVEGSWHSCCPFLSQ